MRQGSGEGAEPRGSERWVARAPSGAFRALRGSTPDPLLMGFAHKEGESAYPRSRFHSARRAAYSGSASARASASPKTRAHLRLLARVLVGRLRELGPVGAVLAPARMVRVAPRPGDPHLEELARHVHAYEVALGPVRLEAREEGFRRLGRDLHGAEAPQRQELGLVRLDGEHPLLPPRHAVPLGDAPGSRSRGAQDRCMAKSGRSWVRGGTGTNSMSSFSAFRMRCSTSARRP